MDLFNIRLAAFFLSLIGCCAGQGALPAGPLNSIIGRNITFNTIATTGNFLTINWNFNGGGGPVQVVTYAPRGLQFGPGYSQRVTLNSTTGAMNLGPLTGADSGAYSVSMVTDVGNTLVGSTMLNVFVPVSNVVITSNVSEAVEYRTSVQLTCTGTGSFLTYTWLNGTAPVVADGTHVLLSSNGSMLTVAQVLRNDLTGPIYCNVSNALETGRSAPFSLNVSYGPDAVALMVNPSQPAIPKGTNLTLSCSVVSVPPAQIGWLFNGVMLTQVGATLGFANATQAQSGNYSCVAVNAKTQRNNTSPTVTINVVELLSGATINGPTTLLVAGNSSANLSCQAATGIPDTREWFKGETALVPSNRVTIAADRSSVLIQPVQKEDSGEYKCKLTNSVNKEWARYKMQVNFGPEDVTISHKKLEDGVEMICSFRSVPAPTFTWKLNGTLLSTTTANYVIQNPTPANSGDYMCTAKNNVTGLSSSSSKKLAIKKDGSVEEGLSSGAVAGIVIGVLLALILIIGICIYMRRKTPIQSPY